MAAGATYEPIATTTLSSNVQSVTFSSISSNFTDLILVGRFSAVTGATATVYMQLNGDTNTNYSATSLIGTSGAGSTRITNSKGIYIGDGTSGVPTGQVNALVHLQNYANTTTNKTVLARYNSASTEVSASVGLWRSTSAINQILIYIGFSNGGYSDNFASGSTFTLYGIAAA